VVPVGKPRLSTLDAGSFGHSSIERKRDGCTFAGGVATVIDFMRDRLAFFTRCAREQGDIAPIRVGPFRCVLFSHPSHVRELLITKQHLFVKGYSVRMLRSVLGDGLLASEGETSRWKRRVVKPALSRERAHEHAEEMVAVAVRRVRRWPRGEPIDVHLELSRLTMEVAVAALLGPEGAGAGDALHPALEAFIRESGTRPMLPLPVFDRFPTPGTLRRRRMLRDLDAFAYGAIASRRKAGARGRDLLDALLAATDERGHPLGDRALRDEIVTVLLGAHDTTANALAWALYLIDGHRHVEERLRAELGDVLGERAPTIDDLPRIRYLEWVILETLRLFPPGWALSRDAAVGTELGGYPLAAGDTAVVSQWVIHRDPRWWDRPGEFVPERWTADPLERQPKIAYFPFGAGPRGCPGSAFAMSELPLLLATIMQRVSLSRVPGHQVRPQPIVSLRPGGGLIMTAAP
jgi:cytochrome P450